MVCAPEAGTFSVCAEPACAVSVAVVVVAGTSMEFIVQLTGTLFTVLWPEQDARLKVELHQYDGCRRYRFDTVMASPLLVNRVGE